MNNLNNQIINLEEARNILKFAKRIYPALNGLTVEYGDVFAYYPNDFVITIPAFFEDVETGMFILEHVNKEFNATFDYNLREMSIQALLHECGHHIDFEGKIMTQRINEYLEYDNYNRELFEEMSVVFSCKVDDYLDQLREIDEMEEFYGEIAENVQFELEQKQIELEMDNKELDYMYRMLPTEYAADKFSARFFMTYLRPYKKCNYNI